MRLVWLCNFVPLAWRAYIQCKVSDTEKTIIPTTSRLEISVGMTFWWFWCFLRQAMLCCSCQNLICAFQILQWIQNSARGKFKIVRTQNNNSQIIVVGNSCRPKIARSCNMRPRAKRHDSTRMNSTLTSRATGRPLSWEWNLSQGTAQLQHMAWPNTIIKK